MNPYDGFIFDLNGTIIDDMPIHEEVWHYILTEKLGKDISKAATKKEMYGKSEEMLERVFGKNYFDEKTLHYWIRKKEEIYQEIYQPKMQPIAGLPHFINRALNHKIKIAIGSAALHFNIDFVLDGLNLRSAFHAIIGSEDVSISKPHPETFLKAAQQLDLPPVKCVVFEDTPKGVECAQNAGMKAVVLLTTYEEKDFKNFSNVLFCVDNYQAPQLEKLF